MSTVDIRITVRTGLDGNADLGRIEVNTADDGVGIGMKFGRQDWCLPKDHGQRKWDRSDYSPPKLSPPVHDSPSYSKIDIGQREWDRSYNPPLELPPQVYQPLSPPQDWETPVQYLEAPHDPIVQRSSNSGVAGGIGAFFVAVIMNGLLWSFFRVVCENLFPTQAGFWFMVPMMVSMGIAYLVIEHDDDVLQNLDDNKRIGFVSGWILSLVLLILIGVSENTPVMGQ